MSSMTTLRTLTLDQKAESLRRAKEEKLCRWCGLDVKRYSTRCRSFCSPQCVHEHSLRSDMNYARHQVYKRDHGVCSQCGLNCSRWFREFKKWMRELRLHLNTLNPTQCEIRDIAIMEYFWLSGLDNPKKSWVHRSTFWDMDHILPVVHGGGQCGMDNLTTLCVRCHRDKTAKQKRESKKSV